MATDDDDEDCPPSNSSSSDVIWTHELTVALIRALEVRPTLWNAAASSEAAGSRSFGGRRGKAEAWLGLAEAVGVGVEACKRRTESLLASCRRERKRIARSLAEDPLERRYRPTWVYWREFGFWRALTKDADVDAEEPERSAWPMSSRRPPRQRAKKRHQEQEQQKAPKNQDTQTKRTKASPCDEYDAFGIMIACKLRRMDAAQRLQAENIINRVLYMGTTSQLSEATTVCSVAESSAITAHTDGELH